MNPTVQDPGNPTPIAAGPRYNQGILGRLGGDPNNHLISSLYNTWQQHKNQQNQQNQQFDQQMSPQEREIAGPDASSQPGWTGSAATPPPNPGYEDQMPSPPMSPETQDQPSQSSMTDALDLASDSFAHGKMVTSPTVALLGEKGPEAVIPMHGGPEDKTSGALLTDQPIAVPKTLGGTARARYNHPHGPVATARTKPISADLPLRQNLPVR